WRYVTYTDAEGNEYSGWVAIEYLGETKSGEESAESAATIPTPTPETPAPPVQPPSTGKPDKIDGNESVTPDGIDPRTENPYNNCVSYAMDRRPDLGYPGGSSAADYITKYNVEKTIGEMANENTDLTTIIAVGYAIVWPANHRGLRGYDGGCGHIAIVEEVYDDHIVVSHANFGESSTPLNWSGENALGSLYMIGPTEP
ncbi:MAG TPA: CHAP domain-containing protein, partial [Anaerolineae bacterium]|nr:CHAP domain-containing protein [Anaerolineae bacterium]